MKTKTVSARTMGLSIFLSALTALGVASTAQSAEELGLIAESSARISFVPRDDSPTPRTTQSGASRRPLPNACGGLPVLPESGVGLTTSSSPSLFVYFAKNTTVEKARLTLKSLDEEESEYYEAVVTLPQAELTKGGGVVAFELPNADAELALNQEYAWSLILMCEGSLRPDSPMLRGYLKRIDDGGISAQTENVSLVESAMIYGDAGIWHDLVSTLAAMRSDNSNSAAFTQYWSDVMASVGLAAIADEPLITP